MSTTLHCDRPTEARSQSQFPKAQGGILELLVLHVQQSKTQIYNLVLNYIKQRKAVNPHIWTAVTRECLKIYFMFKQLLKTVAD